MKGTNVFSSKSTVLCVFVLFLFVSNNSPQASKLKTCDFSFNENCKWMADYLVVGTGSGGSPVISRLSADTKFSVLGFEAGDNFDDDPIIARGENVMLISANATKYNWMIKDAQQADMGIGMMTGGSGSHNGMQATHVSNGYAQILQSYGGPNWSQQAIGLASKSMENYTVADGTIASSRGLNGFVNVRRPATGPVSGSNSLAYRLAKYIEQMSGYSINPDYNDRNGSPVGPFVRYQMTEEPDGKRESAWTAYLPRNILQKNGYATGNRQLRVLLNSRVTKIIMQGNRAIGINFIRNGTMETAYARRAVIVAGSVFTSQLLQLSGIGPSDLLKRYGIPVVINNPNVGRNVFNHASVFLFMSFNATEFPGLLSNDPAALYAGGAFMPKWTANGPLFSGTRDFQIGWFSNLFAPNTLVMLVSHLRPKSTGYEMIQSKDPLKIPIHNSNILSDPQDQADFSTFLYEFVQNLVDYIHERDSSFNMINPANGQVMRWNSAAEAKAYLLASASKAYHYGGQCRMSTSPALGVVDEDLKVHGSQNLYVSGSPVFPEAVDSTLNVPSILVGHMLADILIDERNSNDDSFGDYDE